MASGARVDEAVKSPSRYDGKPIGTPTDAKSAFHAGVVVGPDQIERAEQLRKLRNRAVKSALKSAWSGLTERERDEARFQSKRKRARARQWLNLVHKGHSIASIAAQAKRTPEEVHSEIKWLESRQGKRR